MSEPLHLNNLESIEDAILRHDKDKIIIDWIDLDDPSILNSLKRLLFQRRSDFKQWSSIEIRKCLGHGMPRLIRWVLKASARTKSLHTLILVSILDEDVALAIQKSNKRIPAKLKDFQVLGSPLSPMTLSLISQVFGAERGNTSLITLSFSNSYFLPGSISKFVEASSRCPSFVQQLNLFCCRMADAQVAELVDCLQSSRHSLKSLDLGKNFCGVLSMRALGKWLTSPQCALESLNLSLQHLGFDTPTLNIIPLLTGLAENNSLRFLYLRGNPIDDQDGRIIESFVNALLRNDCLEYLILTDCFMSSQAYELILKHISNFKGLRKLWMDGIQRTSRQMHQLLADLVTNGLSNNKNITLEELYLPFIVTDLISNLNIVLDQNFGGKRLLHHEVISPALWPQILGRINSANLPKRRISKRALPRQTQQDQEDDKQRKTQIRRVRIMYHMFRENAALQHLLNQ